jgi:hypothetical protein
MFPCSHEIITVGNYKDTKPANPECRLYWCLIEFTYWKYSQLCWHFRPAFKLPCYLSNLSLVSSSPLPCVNKYTVYTYTV